MFESASLAAQGLANDLDLAAVRDAIVILVDGLGVENLKFRAGHAPFLNRALEFSKPIDSMFPSTTATCLTSLLTGFSVGEHAIIGYSVFDRRLGRPVNLLTGWNQDVRPTDYFSGQSIAAMSKSANIPTYSCGPAEYAATGFTQLNNAAADYQPAKSISDRIDAVLKTLTRPGKSLSYLYIPELDQAAHSFGSESEQWLRRLEEVDFEIKRLVSKIDASTGVLLTADHGIVDVKPESQIFLDAIDGPKLQYVGGDPRASFIYLADQSETTSLKATYESAFSGMAFVVEPDELIEKGWFGKSVTDQARRLMPDLFLIARSKTAFYHRDFAKPQSLRMIGQHGSISATELKVPLLRWGKWAN